MTSGRFDFDYELLAEDAQGSLNMTGRGSVFRVEHAPDRSFIRAGKCCELVAGEAALPEGERQCGFGGHAGRHGNPTFAGPWRAWCGDVVTPLDPAGDRLLQGVNRFGESFGFVGAGSQAFREVAERDDDFAGAIGPEMSGVDEVHDAFPRFTRYRMSSRLRPSWRIIAESRPGASSFRRFFTMVKR